MREKRRYLQFHLISGKKFSAEEAKHLLYEAVFSLLGERGAAGAAVHLKAFNPENQLMLVKCSLKMQEEAIAAMAMKVLFRGEGVALRLQKIYGTLEKAKSVFPELRKARERDK